MARALKALCGCQNCLDERIHRFASYGDLQNRLPQMSDRVAIRRKLSRRR